MDCYCIHRKTWPKTAYEPEEVWCELGLDNLCENCSDFRSKDDYEDDLADYNYERYEGSLDY